MAAPELRLSVGLDLEFFRGQMRKAVNIAQSEFTAQLAVRIDRNKLNTELNNLQKAIKRRTYRIEIGGNLDAAPSKINALRQALQALEGTKAEIGVGGIASINTKEARKIRTALRASMLGAGGKILIPTSIVPSITNADVTAFKKAVEGKLSGIKVNVGIKGGDPSGTSTGAAGLYEYMRGQGMSGGNMPGATSVGRSERLRKALEKQTVKQLNELAKGQGLSGYTKLKKDPLINKLIAELGNDAAEALLGNIKMQMRGAGSSPIKRSFLDQIARAVFFMAGVDPSQLRAQQQRALSKRRRLPNIDWSSSVPPRQGPSIGPSSTGRALPPAWRGLPGTSFSSQKLLLGDLLTPSMKGSIRDAANAFVDGIRQNMNATIRQIKFADLGGVTRRALSPQHIAGLLPAGVGREAQRYATGAIGGESRDQMMARRTAEAYARSAFRSMDVMGGGTGRPASPYSYAYRGARPQGAIVPYAAPGAIVPAGTTAQAAPTGSRGGGMAMGGTAGGLSIPNLPGTGIVQSLGTEFAFAAKQVLLFGTAYKALSFLTGFPQQVGDAVGALQSFRNTLKAISPSAGEAAASSQFILDVVQKYNVPLQSARDGFTKLYASMQPAGFSGNEIRDLFLSISQAAATFGMSADKVDRVNYAFAQMASKGQVMSEELKGQLGDVLPGAMAIFAEAAGFKGPEAITKFSKALEDGAYKGVAMKTLLTNVSMIMKQEFGPGAEGAARTFQGSMNRMQNSLKLLYEAFEPVAVGFLNSVVMPMTDGIKTISDGFTAFFSGVAAKTSGGFAIAQELEKLKPAFDGIRANVAALAPTLQGLANVLLGVSKAFLQIAGNPFVGYVARVYLNVLLLTTAIQVLNLRALVPLIASFARSAYALIAFNIQCVRAGQGAAIAGLQFRTAGLTLRTFFATTGVGLVLVGIGLLIERFLSMNQALADTKEKALGAASAIRNMSQTEARQAENQAAMDVKTLQALQARPNQGKGDIAISSKEEDALKRAGVKTGRMVMGSPAVPGSLPDIAGYGQKSVDVTQIQGAILARQQIAATAARQITDLQFQEKQAQSPANLSPISPSAEKTKKESLESYYSFADQLSKAQMQTDIERIQSGFDHRFKLLNSYYDLQEARANSFQKITISFQKELLAIEQERQQASISAQAAVMKAQSSVAGGVASTAMVGGGMTPVVAGSGTGFSSAQLQRATSAAAKFNGIANMCSESVKTFYKSLGITLPGVTAWADTVRMAGKTMTDWSKLKAGDIVATGRPGDTPHVGVYTGGENVFHQSSRRGLRAGNYPDLNYFKQGGYFVRPNATGGAGAPRKVPSSEKRDLMAQQEASNALIDQGTIELRAQEIAAKKTEIAFLNYVAAIAPTADQELQNRLLEKRNELMSSGLSEDFVETEMKIFEATEKARLAGLALDKSNEKQVAGYKKLNEELPLYIESLKEGAIIQQSSGFITAQSNLIKQIAMARAITPEAEMRTQLAQSGVTDPAQQGILIGLENQKQKAEKLKQDLQGIASSISESFGNAFKGMITGSMTAQQALSGFFQGIADSFADMAVQVISQYLKMQLIQGLTSLLNLGGGATTMGGSGFFNPKTGLGVAGPNFGLANGGIIQGKFMPITPFASGGIVRGPTMGLVGEGRYNEAVVPLPDGKSIPVDLSGMGGGAGAISTNIVINVNNGQAQSNSSGGSSDLGRKMEGAVKQVIVNELRPGGLLSGGRR